MNRFALFAAASLAFAACSEVPSAPTVAAEPPDARMSADLIGGPIVRDPGVTVKLHLIDQGLGNVAGTTFEFKSSAGVAKTIADNGTGDADARPGYYSVQMPKAVSYTATAKTLPADISFDGASKTVSYFNSPTLVDMGVLYLNIKPGFFITTYFQGAVVKGQTIKVTGPGGFSATITDGSANDKDSFGNPSPADGKYHVRLPVTGTYKICAMTSPAWGWGGCQDAWALQYFIGYPVSFNYKQEWVVVGFP
jgi:hypothetical protein